jgi:AbrB family looped-hinge helix DNA binding protein
VIDFRKSLVFIAAISQWYQQRYNGIMGLTITLDKAGRVVLPKSVRDELHLAAGDQLELTVEGERLTLEPRRAIPPLQKERGVWVFRTGEPLSAAETRETIQSIRTRRRLP